MNIKTEPGLSQRSAGSGMQDAAVQTETPPAPPPPRDSFLPRISSFEPLPYISPRQESHPHSMSLRETTISQRRVLAPDDLLSIASIKENYSTAAPKAHITVRQEVVELNTSNWSVTSKSKILKRLSFSKTDKPQPHGEFANTADGYPFSIGYHDFMTVEHYFQCVAHGGPKGLLGKDFVGRKPVCGPQGMSAESHAQKSWVKRNKSSDWWTSGENNAVMRAALEIKYHPQHHPALFMRLLKTLDNGYPLLVQTSTNDRYWGTIPPVADPCDMDEGGQRDNGENKMGLMLMELRSKLQAYWKSITAPDDSVSAEQARILEAYEQAFPEGAVMAGGGAGSPLPDDSESFEPPQTKRRKS